MVNPTFIFSFYPTMATPMYYDVQVTDLGTFHEHNGIFNLLAAKIRLDLANITRGYNQSLLRGYLSATSASGATKAFQERISIAGITDEVLYEILMDIQHSSDDILLTDLVWAYNFDMTSYVRGGATKIKPPYYTKGSKALSTWLSVPDNVSCAAFAICYEMYAGPRRYEGRGTKRNIKDAKALMTELSWGKYVDYAELGKFVLKYPQKKLVILVPDTMTIPSNLFFTGTEFDGQTKHIVYIIHDVMQRHFAAAGNLNKLIKTKLHLTSNSQTWCHQCLCIHSRAAINQIHVTPETRLLQKQMLKCVKCGTVGKHKCAFFKCALCGVLSETTENTEERHRCILWKNERPESRNSFADTNGDGSKPALWAYDFESRIEYGDESIQEVIVDFDRAPDGRYLTTQVNVIRRKYSESHEVCLAVLKNVFTNQIVIFRDDDPNSPVMSRFLIFLAEFNGGNNIVVAHNGSGYDAKLLLFHCYERYSEPNVNVIQRGSKILQLVLGYKAQKNKIVFIDSLRHLPGSLKALAKDYCDGLLEKGYFPHMFTKPENYSYTGSIPDKKYFDIAFGAKKQSEVDDFNNWHSAQDGVWNFQHEFEKYCINDVEVLAVIMKKYNDIGVKEFGISPWFNATSPSYVHECSIRDLSKNNEDAYHLQELKETNMVEFKNVVEHLAREKTWCVLQPYEYWFARAALRGGRTCITRLYCELTPEQKAAGYTIDYDDVVSMYPTMQIAKDFPVGTPTVYVFSPQYYPCRHKDCKDSAELKCLLHGVFYGVRERVMPGVKVIDCYKRNRPNSDKPLVQGKTLDENWQPLVEDIMNWFGFVCCDIQPCKILHPILPTFDKDKNKCLFSCEPIYEGVFTTVELQCALKHGYILKAVHSYHAYNKAPSIFKDLSQKLYIQKMINSREEPEDLEALAAEYDEKFDKDFGDLVRNTHGKWGDNPAQKATFKVLNNAGWGKHAQNPILPTTEILHVERQFEEIMDFHVNCADGNMAFKQGYPLGKDKMMYKFEKTVGHSFANTYLPAAVFVPSYARITLVEKLLDDGNNGHNVLMCDTDSYIAIRSPGTVRETGTCLGDWEKEKVDFQHGGIEAFVGLGPKTYSLRCFDGYKMPPKTKGVRLSWATETIANYDVFEELAKNHLSGIGRTGVMVPQTNFVANMRKGKIYTIKSLKHMGINIEEAKGTMDKHGLIWPFGYAEAPEPFHS